MPWYRRPRNPETPAHLDKATRKTPKAMATLVVATVSLFATGGVAQESPATPPADQQETQMQEFVFLFRHDASALSEEDLRQQNKEARTWALRQLDAGRELDPHMIDAERYVVRPGGETAAAANPDGAPVVAILFLKAKDFDEAVALAESHPGPRHGASIEVRPWHEPAPGTATPPQR